MSGSWGLGTRKKLITSRSKFFEANFVNCQLASFLAHRKMFDSEANLIDTQFPSGFNQTQDNDIKPKRTKTRIFLNKLILNQFQPALPET